MIVAAALAACLGGLLAFFAARADAVPDSYGWQVGCRFSHVNMDDPIVFPGQPGASHQHQFFGAQSTDAFSTLDSLRASATNCAIGEDGSGYWTPTLLVNGVPQKPNTGQFYYRARTQPQGVKPFPAGLRIVAGNAKATGPQSDQVVDWGCASDSTLTGNAAPIDCGSQAVMVHVYFPDCWDGVNLDSADHKSHMAYSQPGGQNGYQVCPPTHPVALPAMRFKLTWNTVHSAAGISLSSGPSYTLHGDFFNGWEAAKLSQMTHDCINAVHDCGTFLPNGNDPATPPIPTPTMPRMTMPPTTAPSTGPGSEGAHPGNHAKKTIKARCRQAVARKHLKPAQRRRAVARCEATLRARAKAKAARARA